MSFANRFSSLRVPRIFSFFRCHPNSNLYKWRRENNSRQEEEHLAIHELHKSISTTVYCVPFEQTFFRLIFVRLNSFFNVATKVNKFRGLRANEKDWQKMRGKSPSRPLNISISIGLKSKNKTEPILIDEFLIHRTVYIRLEMWDFVGACDSMAKAINDSSLIKFSGSMNGVFSNLSNLRFAHQRSRSHSNRLIHFSSNPNVFHIFSSSQFQQWASALNPNSSNISFQIFVFSICCVRMNQIIEEKKKCTPIAIHKSTPDQIQASCEKS